MTIAIHPAELIETRHYLHERPELSEQEAETSAYVAGRLRALGLEPKTGVGGHGVMADIDGARPGRTLAIRADMDALPIHEEANRAYRSRRPGIMHACGHDGHTAILLGVARALLAERSMLAGRIRLIFQPAEETVGGARRMCEAGALAGVDAVVALHGWPQVGVGQIGVRAGAMMASADSFDIEVRGRGGHAAYPHATVDPIVVAAQIVLALQTIASREIDPSDSVVLSVTKMDAGTAYNVIPGSARLAGTYRTLRPDTRIAVPDRIRRVAHGICSAARAECECRFAEGTAPVMNDPAFTELVAEVGSELLGAENVIRVPHPSMGAEDFAEYLQRAPGAMFRLGLGDTAPIHTPTFDFDDRALPVGVEMFVGIARKYLSAE